MLNFNKGFYLICGSSQKPCPHHDARVSDFLFESNKIQNGMTITVSGSSIKNFIFFVKLFLENFWKNFYDIFCKNEIKFLCLYYSGKTNKV